jgi:hypothetical protein
MKRSNRKRHRPEEVVAKLRQADESLPVAAGGGGYARAEHPETIW